VVSYTMIGRLPEDERWLGRDDRRTITIHCLGGIAMKTTIAALTSAAVLAVPGAALARPADTPPKSPPADASTPGRIVEPPNRATVPFDTSSIAPATASVATPDDGDGLGTLAVVLIAGGAAVAAAGSGFAAGRVRVQRRHTLAH
jgi:hypothetical protein